MKKRLFSLFMSLIMVISIVGILPTMTVGAETLGDYEYEILDDGTVEITGYNGSSTNLTIPSTIAEKKVKSIGDYAFEYCDNLMSVTIPNSVTNIGYGSFYYCERLTSITIPNSVTSIGVLTFWGTKWLEGKQKENPLVIVNGILIDGSMASGKVTIPDSITSIVGSAFSYCDSLTSVTIPNSVKSIGDKAFYGCTQLKDVTIPENVEYIEDYAFGYYEERFGSDEDYWDEIVKDDDFKIKCYSGTAGEEYAKDNGFDYELIEPEYEYEILDDGTIEITEYNGSATTLTIPSTIDGKKVTSIGNVAFADCDSLTSITLPNSIKSIGFGAFDNCRNLTNIELPNSIESIGFGAFEYCESLTNITIPNSVTSIGEGTFTGCTSLKSIIIPNSVTNIGERAFEYCESLTIITIPNSVTSIGKHTFLSCTSLTSITLPNSVESIGYGAFMYCESLTNITIPNSVTSIGDYSFVDCTSLTSITIPNSVTGIGNGAFHGCTSLTNVTIPKSVENIGQKALGYYEQDEDDYFETAKVDGFKIKCYKNTAGEKYAKDNGFDYELLDSELQGVIYYQTRVTNSAVRFIAEVNVEDVQNANSGIVKIIANGNEFSYNIERAYKSLIANKQKITADDGKCFIISPAIETCVSENNISAEFTLDSCYGSISRDIVIH